MSANCPPPPLKPDGVSWWPRTRLCRSSTTVAVSQLRGSIWRPIVLQHCNNAKSGLLLAVIGGHLLYPSWSLVSQDSFLTGYYKPPSMLVIRKFGAAPCCSLGIPSAASEPWSPMNSALLAAKPETRSWVAIGCVKQPPLSNVWHYITLHCVVELNSNVMLNSEMILQRH